VESKLVIEESAGSEASLPSHALAALTGLAAPVAASPAAAAAACALLGMALHGSGCSSI